MKALLQKFVRELRGGLREGAEVYGAQAPGSCTKHVLSNAQREADGFARLPEARYPRRIHQLIFLSNTLKLRSKMLTLTRAHSLSFAVTPTRQPRAPDQQTSVVFGSSCWYRLHTVLVSLQGVLGHVDFLMQTLNSGSAQALLQRWKAIASFLPVKRAPTCTTVKLSVNQA
jgi:hypothetical protein